MGLTWKAKGKRPNLSGDDRSSSSSDDEDSVDEVWAGMPKLTKGKGQSAYPKDDHNNNTARLHMVTLTLTKGHKELMSGPGC